MAANLLRGEIELTAGDATYKLVMDANAMIYVQGLLKRSPRQMIEALFADPDDTELVRGLLWGCLQRHHECHLIAAGDILSDAGEVAVCATLMALATEAYGLNDPAEDKDGANPPKAKRKRTTKRV